MPDLEVESIQAFACEEKGSDSRQQIRDAIQPIRSEPQNTEKLSLRIFMNLGICSNDLFLRELLSQCTLPILVSPGAKRS
jgi:hypothetical protein